MLYQRKETVAGNWLKAKDLQNGTKAKLLSETTPKESVFEGKSRMQDVAKIQIQGNESTYNVSLNKTTINGLIEAFGPDSKEWMNKVLTVQTEKTTIAGRRVTVLYLLPEGFELTEDVGGYVVIGRKNGNSIPRDNDINVEEIPF